MDNSQKKLVYHTISRVTLYLSIMYLGITTFYLILDPAKFLSFWPIWRISILFTPYSPALRDLFLFSLFSVALYLRVKENFWIGLLFTWSFFEVSYNYLNIPLWSYFYSADLLYYPKLALFTVAFLGSIFLIRKNRYKINLNPLVLGILAALFALESLSPAYYLPIPLAQTGIFLLAMFDIVGKEKPPSKKVVMLHEIT